MIPSAFPGPFSTYSADDTALNHGTIFRVRDIETQVPWKNRNNATFYLFLRELRRAADATQPRHEWGERDKAPNYLVVKAAAASGDASIDVFDAYQAVTGDSMINDRTSEIIRIDAIDDADTISVAATTGFGRGFSGSTAAAMKVGDRLTKLGNNLAEQGTAADSRSVTPEPFWNYIHPFQKTWQVTLMQENSVMVDGVGQFDEYQMRSIWEMDEEVNAALLFSRRNRVVAANGNLYTMNGFDQQVRTNSFDFSNIVVPTWSILNEKFSSLFQSSASSSEKVFFCGQGAYSALLNAARTVGIKPQNWEALGMTDVTAIEVDGGTIQVVKDYRTFKGLLSGSGRLVDMANIAVSNYNGWDRMLFTNVQANNQPTIRKDMAMQALTLTVHFEDTHAIVDGLSNAMNDARF